MYVELQTRESPLELPLVRRVLEAAQARSVETYLVGGYVRDLLWDGRKRDSKDLDFAVAGGAAVEFAQYLAGELNAHYVPLDLSFDTARVVLDDGSFVDFAGCVGGSIETDLRRRDFTVNALAIDARRPDCILDLVGGMADIEKRLLRATSKDILIDDPLRLLRAFRFRAVLDATIEPQTLVWIKETADKIEAVACERINTEMFTLFESERAGAIVSELAEVGLLESIYPELRATRRVTPNAYHHLNLFDHSVETVRQLEGKLAELPEWVHESGGRPLSYGVSKLAAAKLAALLHDIGKPDTWEINEEGRHCFYNHDNLGAEMAERMAERMKWSKPVSRFIAKLIKMHLRPGALFHAGDPMPRTVQRFYRKAGADTPELMILAFGDLGATCGDGLPEESRVRLANKMVDLLDGYKTFVEQKLEINRLLTGDDVMRLLGMQPGREVGEILEALSEAQSLGEVTDRPTAEEFVAQYRAKKYSS